MSGLGEAIHISWFCIGVVLQTLVFHRRQYDQYIQELNELKDMSQLKYKFIDLLMFSLICVKKLQNIKRKC